MKLGKKRQYELGKFFRKRYHTLIANGTNLNDIVYVQSEFIAALFTN